MSYKKHAANYIYRKATKLMLAGFLTIAAVIYSLGVSSEVQASTFNDSCISEDNVFLQLKSAVGTLGVSLAIESGFQMSSDTGAEGEVPVNSSSKSYPCVNPENPTSDYAHYSDGSMAACGDNNQPVMRCQTPTMPNSSCTAPGSPPSPYTCGVKFTLNDQALFFLGVWDTPSGCNCSGSFIKVNRSCTCTGYDGDTYGALGNMRVTNVGDKLCVQYWTFLGWQSLGCKYVVQNQPAAFNAGCFVSTACYERGSSNSMSVFPVTAVVMQCVKETIYKLFVNPAGCSNYNPSGASLTLGGSSNSNSSGMVTSFNMLPMFQSKIRNAVQLLLTLYVMIYGMRIALSGHMPKKSEAFVFIMKMVLVMYFSVGIYTGAGNNPTNNAAVSQSNYEDGLNSYVIPGFLNGANALANMLLQSASNQQQSGGACTDPLPFCNYPTSCYQPGYDYLALWDSLDCRIAYYLGFANPSTISGMGISVLLSMIFPGFAAFQMMFMIATICLFIFMVSLAIYFIHTYIIALLAMSILVFMAPLFVPMLLFKITKPYFDAWVKLLFSFAIQPAIIAGYMALMLNIFDNIFYGTCTWNSALIPGTDIRVWTLQVSNDPNCTNTFGYVFNAIKTGGNAVQELAGIFFEVQVLDPTVATQLMGSLLIMVLFAFLFYYFGKMLSEFAADLAGGPSLGAMSVGANAGIDAAAELVKMYIDYKTGGKTQLSKAGKAVGSAKGGGKGKGISATGATASRKGGVTAVSSPSPTDKQE